MSGNGGKAVGGGAIIVIFLMFFARVGDNVAQIGCRSSRVASRVTDDVADGARWGCRRASELDDTRYFRQVDDLDVRPLVPDELIPTSVEDADEVKNLFKDVGDDLVYIHKGESRIISVGKGDGLRRFDDIEDVVFPDKVNMVVTDETLNRSDLEVLANKGIEFIVKRDVYLRQRSKPFKVIAVFSEDPLDLYRMYGLNHLQAKDFVKYAKPLKESSMVTMVRNQEQLRAQIQMANASGKEPVIIANNNNGTVFGSKFEEYESSNFVTCKGAFVHGNFFGSTDVIGIENTFKSIAAASKENSLINFYKGLAFEYNSLRVAGNQKKVLFVAGGVATTAGGSAIIIYYTD